jgi:uncharacterized protein (TIGR02117 family)
MRRGNQPGLLRLISWSLTFWLFLDAARAIADWVCAPGTTPCASVFVVHNSWHAAIVIGRDELNVDVIPELNDFPDAKFIEFSWGDQDYFPDPNSGVWAGLRAALWSRGSVVHMVGFRQNVAQFYRGAEIFELRLTPAALQLLSRHLTTSYARRDANRASASPGLFPYSRFYPATGKFSMLHTCNTWVAEALAAAGLPISPGNVLTAGSLAGQLADIAKQR